MRVLRLFVINSGVIKQNLIDFTNYENHNQDFLCLSGVNGSGKTTVMELIYSLIQLLDTEYGISRISVDQRRAHVLTRTDFAQLDLLIEGKILSIVVGDSKYIQKSPGKDQMIVIDNNIKEIIRDWEDYAKNEVGEEDIEERRKRYEYLVANAKSKRKLEIKGKSIFPNLLKKIRETVFNKETNENNLPEVFYFPVNSRIIIDKRYKTIPTRNLFNYRLVHKFNPDPDDLNSIFVYLDYAYPELFEELIDWVNRTVLIDKKIIEVNRPNFKTIIRTKTGDNHGLEELSSGEESILNLAVQVFLHSSNNTVFLIDEIDESLHPEFQHRIIKVLREIQKEEGSQIIISSHSSHIWNEFKDDDQAMIRLTEVVR